MLHGISSHPMHACSLTMHEHWIYTIYNNCRSAHKHVITIYMHYIYSYIANYVANYIMHSYSYILTLEKIPGGNAIPIPPAIIMGVTRPMFG